MTDSLERLTVPPTFQATLRRAALKEVGFWVGAATKDVAGIHEAEQRHDTRLSALRRSDFVNSYGAVSEAAQLLIQMPTSENDNEHEIEIRGGAQDLESLVQTTVQICAEDLSEIADCAPLQTEDVRAVSHELEWWTARLETLNERIAQQVAA